MLGYACVSIEGKSPNAEYGQTYSSGSTVDTPWPTVQHTSHVVSVSQRTPFYCGCTRVGRIPWYDLLYLTNKVVAVCNALYFYFVVPT
jgi:hypothetical protein